MSFQEPERDLCYVGLIGKKILKKGWDNGKKYPWTESGGKKNSFEIHVIILRISNLQNFLPKHQFSFTLVTVLKMANETN